MDTRSVTAPAAPDGLWTRDAAGRLPASTDAPAVTWVGVVQALGQARREAWALPIERAHRRQRRLPTTWAGVALRLQAALWEVAAMADVAVRPGTSIEEVARLLVGHGAIIPPAGDAVRALAVVTGAGCAGDRSAAGLVGEAARVADRLAGYLALRARFG